jgi:lathosterol oxidase
MSCVQSCAPSRPAAVARRVKNGALTKRVGMRSADDLQDQFVRSSPLLLFPLLVPINMDLIFFEFGLFFYGYGVYLHWGYELDWPDAHHPVINTAFQHYVHHARAGKGKPFHTGFFFKIWDQLWGSMYTDACFCCKCSVKKGERTPEAYAKVKKPDYSCLLSPSFWLQ